MIIDYLDKFESRLRKKEIKIAVVGLGYVGLPLALEFSRKGFLVFGIEIDKDRLAHLKRKETYITDISSQELKGALKSGKFIPCGDFKVLRETDVVIVCVPTPLKRKIHPDISFIKEAIKSISKNLKIGSLVVLESTTYPGTTDEVILPLLESGGLKHGRDFYLCFSPERIDPGNAKYPVSKIPKIIGGVNREAGLLGKAVYEIIVNKVVMVSSTRVAEITKLLENTFRIVNIGLIDELAMMAHKMKIDIWEVVDAAATKPFGFMPFYPGPGVGGHCLDKKEVVFVKAAGVLKSMEMPDFIEYIQNQKDSDVKVLAFDPLRKRSIFNKVTAASVRPYNGEMVDIITEDGRHLKVTDLHPMFIYNGQSWSLKYARDLRKGDSLPVCLELPKLSNRKHSFVEINIVEQVRLKGKGLVDKIRVKPVDFSWKDYAKEIKSVLRKVNKGKIPDSCWDYLSENVLPLKYFYDLEKMVKINYGRIKLVSGRGPSYSEMPAKIVLNNDFCRFIGYYLSEGCFTKDKSARIRLTFNRGEREYINDVINILKKIGIKSSIYESKICYSSCIKVSSNLFGFLIRDVLCCGVDCYDMNIPEQFFVLDKEKKKSLMSGIFRGDACVEHFFGKWRYRKNEDEYFHNVNTANIAYFTSSRKLFQQLILMLHDFSIVPTFHKREYMLRIFGYDQLLFFKDLLGGKKGMIIKKYLALNKNRSKNKTFQRFGKFATVKVKSVLPTKGDWVYSIETEKPHSFITSYGIVVHNCIPKDPLYLYWKAKKFGFKSRFIKLASEVISYMPEYVVRRLEEALRSKGLELSGANILLIGLTYKKDVKDLRKSPSLDIFEILKKERARVCYHDPLIPYLKFAGLNFKSLPLTQVNLNKFDCVVIATDHSKLDYKLILENAKIIFDTRNIYKGKVDKKVIRL
jgi:nucleotide sugar dehydrogenase